MVFADHRDVTLRLFLRARAAKAGFCTLCGSAYVRPSRQATSGLARALGFVWLRCESCWQLFLLPERLAANAGSEA